MAFIDNSLGQNNGSGVGIWGSITGDILDQTDLIDYTNDNFYPLLSNPAGYLTSLVEEDPIFNAWLATNPLGNFLTETNADLLYYPLTSNPENYITLADVISQDLQSVLDIGKIAEYDTTNSSVILLDGDINDRFFEIKTSDGTGLLSAISGDKTSISLDNNITNSGRKGTISITNGLVKFQQTENLSLNEITYVDFETPTALSTLKFPAKTTGTYILATTEDIVNSLQDLQSVIDIGNLAILGNEGEFFRLENFDNLDGYVSIYNADFDGDGAAHLGLIQGLNSAILNYNVLSFSGVGDYYKDKIVYNGTIYNLPTGATSQIATLLDIANNIPTLQQVVTVGRTFTETDTSTDYSLGVFSGSGANKFFNVSILNGGNTSLFNFDKSVTSIKNYGTSSRSAEFTITGNTSTFLKHTNSSGFFSSLTIGSNSLQVSSLSLLSPTHFQTTGSYRLGIMLARASSNLIAERGVDYFSDSATDVVFTDPTAGFSVSNYFLGYTVFAGAGTVTVGGITYSQGTKLIRNYSNTTSSWTTTVISTGTIDTIPIDGSNNSVSSNGVFDALALKANIATTIAGYGITDAQPLDTDLTSWAAITRASGFDTFVATPSSTNLKSLITDETGSDALVFANAPTLVNPIVGTQSTNDNSTKAASTAYVDIGLALKNPLVDNFTLNRYPTGSIITLNNYASSVTSVAFSSNAANSNNLCRWQQFTTDTVITIDELYLSVTATNAGASATVTLYFYDDNNNGLPGTKLQQEISSAGILVTGSKIVTFTSNITLQPGSYWVGIHIRNLDTAGTNPTFYFAVIGGNQKTYGTSVSYTNNYADIPFSSSSSDLGTNPTIATTTNTTFTVPMLKIKLA